MGDGSVVGGSVGVGEVGGGEDGSSLGGWVGGSVGSGFGSSDGSPGSDVCGGWGVRVFQRSSGFQGRWVVGGSEGVPLRSGSDGVAEGVEESTGGGSVCGDRVGAGSRGMPLGDWASAGHRWSTTTPRRHTPTTRMRRMVSAVTLAIVRPGRNQPWPSAGRVGRQRRHHPGQRKRTCPVGTTDPYDAAAQGDRAGHSVVGGAVVTDIGQP